MPNFYPIVFVHGWGGISDFTRDFNDADERDPYVGWNMGRRYNDPDGWVKFRDTQPNFEGLVLRLIKDFNYYDAANDEELADFKKFLGQAPPAPGEPAGSAALPADAREAALAKSLWIFRFYEYNAEHLRLGDKVEAGLAGELARCGYTGSCVGIPRYAALLGVKLQQIACPNCRRLSDWTEVPGLGLNQVALVGHSMGGLISRFAIQYNLFGAADNVARLMTMSTPHGGARYASPARILRFLPSMREDDIMFIGPEWVQKVIGGQKPTPPLGQLAPTDVFCLVGTRRAGYLPLARDLPRTDGIIDQREAYLEDYPYAFVYNTHSGEYGIRENHDGYQAMRRFLFGDLYVRMQITDIELQPGASFRGKPQFFFHYFLKPRGINAHLNEISERSENQPRPRTLAELQARLAAKPYIIYDGFADSGARVAPEDRGGPGVAPKDKDLPHLQLEHSSFLFDALVGGKLVGAGFNMIPLAPGKRNIRVEDQAFKATLVVEVNQRA